MTPTLSTEVISVNTRKKLLIISYSKLDTDPRILRQIELLKDDFDICTAGLLPSNQPAVKIHYNIVDVEPTFHRSYKVLFRKLVTLFYILPIRFINKLISNLYLKNLKDYEKLYWSRNRKATLSTLVTCRADLIIANDIDTLPLAVKLKSINGGKIYFDAHEYSPLEYENNPAWLKFKAPYYTYLCSKYVALSNYNTTVSNGLLRKYEELTGREFDLVLNAPSYESLNPSSREDQFIKFIHHGNASPDRNTDRLVNAFLRSTRTDIELHLMIINLKSEYGGYIQSLARDAPNIFFHKPVPTSEISSFINQFDVGIYFLPPLNFNQEYALPNKFFEFIQGRLMLAFGPSVEMKKYILEHELGLVGNGFEEEDIIECINSISVEDVSRYKTSVNASAPLLSAETSMNHLKTKLAELCAE